MLTSEYIANFCKKDKQPACAITDTSNLFGVFEFSEKLISKGIQPIIGIQVNLSDDLLPNKINEVIILAKSSIGYQNLVQISNLINKNVNMNKHKTITLEILKKFRLGLIILSGGNENGYIGYPASIKNYDIAKKRALSLIEIFGNHLYIEIQRHGLERDNISEKFLLKIADELGIPIVATNDTYFKVKAEYEAQKILMMIDRGITISSPSPRLLSEENYLKKRVEICELFSDLPEAIDNTIEIARRCSFCLRPTNPVLPGFKIENANLSENSLLEQLSNSGLLNRLKEINNKDENFSQQYFDRLKYELKIIKNMGFSGYYLIISDIIKWAKNKSIPVGPGRGSGAGSIVAWSLEITNLDPLKWGLLFERFLNPERVSMPDFDIDFCPERRDEVIEYIKEKYGEKQIAQIITFGTLQAKAAIRDVGRVLEMPYGQVDKIAKLIPFIPANPVTLSQALETEKELIKEKNNNEYVSKVIDMALSLEKLNRHVSTHPAGIVISKEPIGNYIPLYSEYPDEIPATQFNMKYVEKAGLVKFDILGVKTLTIISKTEQLIKQHDQNFFVSKISLEDELTYKMLSKGETIGVFQLESSGMQNVLKELKPDRFEDIMVVLAMFRPGPMKNIPTYTKRKHKREIVKYEHKLLETVLEETKGIFIYQEQVMKAAQILSGFTLASADILRRAMGKKDKIEMNKQKQKFIEGAIENNIEYATANKIFEDISAFAGYGFNKSHAAAYALIAYQCAWLKCHYPKEFFSCLMTSDIDNTDKISVFYNDLKRLSIDFKPPDINESYDYFKVEYENKIAKSIRCSLSSLKNVGQDAIKNLVKIRNEKGVFKDIDDFIKKIPLNSLGKRGLESLIKSGSLDVLEKNRNKLFKSVPLMLLHSQKIIEDKNNYQKNFFSEIEETKISNSFVNEIDWSINEKEINELGSLGYFINCHPLINFKSILKKMNVVYCSNYLNHLELNPDKKIVKFCGYLSKFVRKYSNRGEWANVELNDLTGVSSIIYYSDALNKLTEMYEEYNIYLIDAEIKYRDNFGFSLIAKRTRLLHDLIGSKKITLELVLEDIRCLSQLRNIFNSSSEGETKVLFKTYQNNKEIILNSNHNIKINKNVLSSILQTGGISKINFIDEIFN